MTIEADELNRATHCYLTTAGRITGQLRTIEIWFAISGATLYMLSGNRADANWVKNAQRQPHVSIRIREHNLEAVARFVKDDAEDALARRLLLEKYGQAQTGLEDWARSSLPMAFDLAHVL
jgi:deazaflavin-dependent oxidoreductase (nitroreductase family)